MADPIIIYIAAGAFALTAVLIMFFLIKEGIKYFNNNNPN